MADIIHYFVKINRNLTYFKISKSRNVLKNATGDFSYFNIIMHVIKQNAFSF